MPIPQLESVAPELLARLRQVSTATAWSALQKLGVRNTYMKGLLPLAPLGPDERIAGRAVTVRYLPAREDVPEMGLRERPYRQAIELLAPNDVLVIDAMGSLEAGTIGDILASRIKYRGAVAVVADGAVRDAPFIRRMGLPVFVKGVHPAPSPAAFISTDVNTPIQCGGVLVLPGDLILADEDGVLVVPRALADKVATTGGEREDLEVFIRGKIEAGRSTWDAYPPNEEVMREYEAQRGKK